MKEEATHLVEKYLKIYPEERNEQEELLDFLKQANDDLIGDWNCFDGHIVASAFVYSLKEKKFLLSV